MFRTRDFVLIFTTIVFLLTSIGATVFLQFGQSVGISGEVDEQFVQQLGESNDQEYVAIIASSDAVSREDRVTSMRAKIAAQSELSAPEEAVAEDELDQIESEEATSTESELVSIAGLQQCHNHSPYLGYWDARDLSVEASEGAILVVRSGLSDTGSSTQTTILQLLKRFSAAPDQTCIGSDVIGIAKDGSLIRNDEAGVYSIFGSGTVIGYALDGFPIYGGKNQLADSCGGATMAGQSAYSLDPQRETIINCFSAAPVRLP